MNSQATLGGLFGALVGFQTGDAYAGKIQTPSIRDIESSFDPIYKSKTDIYEFNAEFDVAENVKMTWLTAYTWYKLNTRQDYNRYAPSVPFNTTPNPVNVFAGVPAYAAIYAGLFRAVRSTTRRTGRSTVSPPATSRRATPSSGATSRFQSSFAGPFAFNVAADHVALPGTGDYFVMFTRGPATARSTTPQHGQRQLHAARAASPSIPTRIRTAGSQLLRQLRAL